MGEEGEDGGREEIGVRKRVRETVEAKGRRPPTLSRFFAPRDPDAQAKRPWWAPNHQLPFSFWQCCTATLSIKDPAQKGLMHMTCTG